MQDYLETYFQWYPDTKLESYPTTFHQTLSQQQRSDYYLALSPPKQKQLELHRKYELRSRFTTYDYLKDTDWQFDEYIVDYQYPNSSPGLHCKCGKKLKYQFVMVSKNHKEKMYLGLQHFSDHLGVSTKVANEIKKGLSQVDFGIDEILWLHHHNRRFPQELWRRYCFAHYRNCFLRKPIALNMQLAKRLAAFKQVDLPIYIVDFQSVLREIKLVNQAFHQLAKPIKNIGTQENFQYFMQDLNRDLLQNNFGYWLNDKQCYTLEGLRLLKTKRISRQILYQQLIEQFIKLNHYPTKKQKQEVFLQQVQQFPLNCFTPTCLNYCLEKYLQYGFKRNFFISLPKNMRQNFLKGIKLQQNMPQVSQYVQNLSDQVASIPKIYQRLVLEQLLEKFHD